MGHRKASKAKKHLPTNEEETQMQDKTRQQVGGSEAHELLNLQQQVGNRAIQRAIGQQPHRPRPVTPRPPVIPVPDGGEETPARTVRCPECGHRFSI